MPAALMKNETIKFNVNAMAVVEGILELPDDPIGVILFAHGSGSSRMSPHNNFIATECRKVKLATLLIDLLTPQEEQDYQVRFDISLLAQRLDRAIEWLKQHDRTASLPIGLFGAGTGAAAALQVAAVRGNDIAAIVSCGGRPDMAGRHALEEVQKPTLFIVGELDEPVAKFNQIAYATLHYEKKFEIVPGATHLFEEIGKLEFVARLAKKWFLHYLSRPQRLRDQP